VDFFLQKKDRNLQKKIQWRRLKKEKESFLQNTRAEKKTVQNTRGLTEEWKKYFWVELS